MDPGEAARQAAAIHGTDFSKIPEFKDITAASITEHVHAINSNCPDERTKFIFKSLTTHIHNFVRETSLTTEEWMAALDFLKATGQKCTDLRHEFILLSDTLGASSLVTAINNPKPPGCTEGTVLGPFFEEDAHDFQFGESIASEGRGHYMYVEGTVLNTKGEPIAGAIIDTWESDGEGKYDNQYENRTGPDCRGRLISDASGKYAYRAVVPVPYGIPDDGPVAQLMGRLGRHIYRPGHLHVQIHAPGYEPLITALYFEGDPYLTSDAVFGVRDSLVVKTELINDPNLARSRGFPDPSKPHVLLKQDFVLPTVEEVKALKGSPTS
ncbi:hypothetical protein EST38_g4271 [Candolleomyces aberdarensis]|uniref:Intradiol ring-cleavage dioxygenases domain-containing protein n=1 Tax=Candolleomyces aberdarensis TaxID=2316362 RepID=A0A4Q2DND6_9AGAR|nr:hypothetical protein EST38_g4271 [Candolleomyces aberdarensis]